MRSRQYFDAIPMLIEESDNFSQHYWDDGAFATWDEFNTQRHHGKCNVAYLDGSVGVFAAPHGTAPNVAGPKDLRCFNFILHVGDAKYEMYNDIVPYGWMNAPTDYGTQPAVFNGQS